MHNTEDKQWWTTNLAKYEQIFVEKIAPKLNLSAIINPEKLHNPYTYDIIVNNKKSDLKHQTSPFFKAKDLYKMNPQYSVTFNKKDYLRYKELYPDLIIYFWVHWKELEKSFGEKTYYVNPLQGVWRVKFVS